jgi:hypothetical protein
MSRLLLVDLERGFVRETERLRQVFEVAVHDCPACLAGGSTICQYALVESCVIRLHDTWHHFTRRLVVASAAGAVTKNDLRLTRCPGISSIRDVVPELKNIDGAPPYWREPAWHVSTEASAASAKLGLTNLLQVQGGVGFVGSPEPDLRRLRNFYAHRRPSLHSKVLQLCDDLAIPRTTPPSGIPLVSPGGTEVFGEWVNSLQFMADVMVQ